MGLLPAVCAFVGCLVESRAFRCKWALVVIADASATNASILLRGS